MALYQQSESERVNVTLSERAQRPFPAIPFSSFPKANAILEFVKESTAEEGYTLIASFQSSSLSPTFIFTTSIISNDIPSSKPEPGQSNEGQAIS